MSTGTFTPQARLGGTDVYPLERALREAALNSMNEFEWLPPVNLVVAAAQANTVVLDNRTFQNVPTTDADNTSKTIRDTRLASINIQNTGTTPIFYTFSWQPPASGTITNIGPGGSYHGIIGPGQANDDGLGGSLPIGAFRGVLAINNATSGFRCAITIGFLQGR